MLKWSAQTGRGSNARHTEIGATPMSKDQIQPVWRMSRLTQDRTIEPVLRDQILRRKRGQENIRFPCSADHKQDWQPYSFDDQCVERDGRHQRQ